MKGVTLRCVVTVAFGLAAVGAPSADGKARLPRMLTSVEAASIMQEYSREQGFTKYPGFDPEEGGLDDDAFYPLFYRFFLTWADPTGDALIGYFSVDAKTGNLWDSVICQEYSSARLHVLQRRIRGRIGLSPATYRQLRQPGPECLPEVGRLSMSEMKSIVRAYADEQHIAGEAFDIEDRGDDQHYAGYRHIGAFRRKPGKARELVFAFVVSKYTGDMWDEATCVFDDTPALERFKSTVRQRAGISESDYRKLSGAGAPCRPHPAPAPGK